MIEAAVKGFSSKGNILVITCKKSKRMALINMNTKLAYFTIWNRLIVWIQDFYIVSRTWTSHRTRANRRICKVHKVSADYSRFRLTIAFINTLTGLFKPLVVNLVVQGLTCSREALTLTQIILWKILANQEAVNSRWCTEGCKTVFRNQRKHLIRLKHVHIINKLSGTADPLTVNLTPACFSPASFCNCKMKAIVYNTVPVFSSNDVSDWIGKIMKYHLWITRGSRGKVHEHWIWIMSCSLSYRTRELWINLLVFFMEVYPAGTVRTYSNKIFYGRWLYHCLFNFFLNVRIIIRNNHLYVCSVCTVFNIWF